ncbi:MAG: hypothetical protein ACRENV_02750 [Candidatus Dormibacteria bacterium]
MSTNCPVCGEVLPDGVLTRVQDTGEPEPVPLGEGGRGRRGGRRSEPPAPLVGQLK